MKNYEEKKAKEYFINLINKTIPVHKQSVKDMQSLNADMFGIKKDSYQIKHHAKVSHTEYKQEAEMLIVIVERINVVNLKSCIDENKITKGSLYFVIKQSLYALDEVDYLHKTTKGREYNQTKKVFDNAIKNLEYNKFETTIRELNSTSEIVKNLTRNLKGNFKEDKYLVDYIVSLLNLERFDAKEELGQRTKLTDEELQKALKQLPIIDLSEL